MTALPARPDDIDDRWLGRILANAEIAPGGGPVSIRSERIGEDRGFTGVIARVHWSAADRHGTVIVKMPDAAQDFERCAREVRFYQALGPSLGALLPRMLHGAADADSGRVVLVLEDVTGRDGDAAAPTPDADIEATVRAIGSMHAAWWRDSDLARHAWLPRWGRGTARAAAPHRRRADRYWKQMPHFMLHHVPEDDPDDVANLLVRTGIMLQERLARIAALPPTLVHADLHADNLVFRNEHGAPRPDDVVILDWQSVSLGPAAYDVTRFVAGAVDAERPLDAVRSHMRTHAAVLRAAGVPAADLAGQADALPDMVVGLFVGFVSGYGGRAPRSMTDRENRMVARALSPRGLFGAARAALEERRF